MQVQPLPRVPPSIQPNMLNDKDQAEKHLRAMHRELQSLEMRRRHPPVHELIQPIQRGWKRHFILTHAASLRPDATTLAAILDHLNTVQYFWRSDFRPTRRRPNRQRHLVFIEQELMAISWHDWERSPVSPTWRKYFRREFLPAERLLPYWYGRKKTEQRYPWFVHKDRRRYEWGYVFRFTSWFELKVEKHWLTHYTEIEPGVAGRIAEIERWMDFHRGHRRFQRLKGKSQWWLHYQQPAWRRTERRTWRETRAHLGFLGNAAADHIPSIQPVLGGTAGRMFSAALFSAGLTQLFAVVRLELLRPPNTRHETGQSHRIPARRARVVDPDRERTSRFRAVCARHLRTDRVLRRRAAAVVRQSEFKRTGRRLLRPAFSAKNPGALATAAR